MKYENTIAFGLLAICVLAWVFIATDAHAKVSANQNNAVMKACLEQEGYTFDKFDTFNFSKAAACFHDWKIAEIEKDYAKMREFLKENPHFKGKNWKWEERAEYNCEKIYSTAYLNNITICTKPYYLN